MNVTFSLGRLTAFVNAIDEQIARKDCDETIDPLDMIEALQAARAALDAPRTEAENGHEPHIQGNHLVGVYVCPTETMLDLLKAARQVMSLVSSKELHGVYGQLAKALEKFGPVLYSEKSK
jgi:hypothetical protein